MTVRKVSEKKRATQFFKYVKQLYAEIDEIKKRLVKLEGRIS